MGRNEYSFWMDGRTKTIIDRTNWQSNCQDKLQKGTLSMATLGYMYKYAKNI